MAKIILNNEEFDFSGYNRSIYFSDENMTSNGYISNLRGTNVANRLSDLAQETITSITIKKDNDVIYELDNIDAKINTMDESYNGDDAVITNVNIQFN